MSRRQLLIAPSILAADFTRLGDEVRAIEQDADWVHFDVMDGRFVPNISFGPDILKAVKSVTRLPLDVHLMIVEPEKYIEDFARAGADRIGVHVETCPHLHRTIEQIHDAGAKACVVLNPSTPAQALEPVLPDIEQVLVMTVNPGFGGQSFIQSMVPKIEAIRTLIDAHNPDVLLEVDGGVNLETIDTAVKAGADVLVAGSAVYDKGRPEHDEPPGARIRDLRDAAGQS